MNLYDKDIVIASFIQQQVTGQADSASGSINAVHAVPILHHRIYIKKEIIHPVLAYPEESMSQTRKKSFRMMMIYCVVIGIPMIISRLP